MDFSLSRLFTFLRFSDVCYFKHAAMDHKGNIILFNPDDYDSSLKKLGNSITSRHDFRKGPNVYARTVQQTMDFRQCLYYEDTPTVYFAVTFDKHYWHAIHDSVLPL